VRIRKGLFGSNPLPWNVSLEAFGQMLPESFNAASEMHEKDLFLWFSGLGQYFI